MNDPRPGPIVATDHPHNGWAGRYLPQVVDRPSVIGAALHQLARARALRLIVAAIDAGPSVGHPADPHSRHPARWLYVIGASTLRIACATGPGRWTTIAHVPHDLPPELGRIGWDEMDERCTRLRHTG